jgi:hypothetical protein
MAFRQTTFDPCVSAQYSRAGHGVAGLEPPAGSVDMMRMEEQLARELAKMRIVDDRKKKEIEKICAESQEIKDLQSKINAAYLNKERGSQITENQYRRQIEIVSDQLSRPTADL